MPQFDLDNLDTYVKATYPDLRKCLQLLQANSITGALTEPGESDAGVDDWRLSAVTLFKERRTTDARKLICSQATHEDIDGMYRWFYDNLGLWSNTPEGQDEAIKIINEGLINVPLVADQEINLSATMVKLTQIGQ